MIGNDPRYQAIIDAYKAGQLQTTAPQYNPIYDIRTEQIKAGDLPPGSQFPIPQLKTTPTTEAPKEPFDPCPPGYQLIDGVCQPDTMFDRGGGDGGGGGDTTPFESPYYGDIYLPMAGGMAQGDPNVPYGEYRTPTVNTELMRFAAQDEYQPTIGSTIGDLFRKGMQFSPVMGLLNALGLGPSYTETITNPRFEGGGFNPFGSPTQPSPIVQPTAESPIPTGINRPGYTLPEPKISISFGSSDGTPKKGTGASGPPGRDYSSAKSRAEKAAKKLGTKLATKGK
jgi:hypothetical protein